MFVSTLYLMGSAGGKTDNVSSGRDMVLNYFCRNLRFIILSYMGLQLCKMNFQNIELLDVESVLRMELRCYRSSFLAIFFIAVRRLFFGSTINPCPCR